jgi:hypothetical protein
LFVNAAAGDLHLSDLGGARLRRWHSSRPGPNEAGRLMPVPRLSFIVPLR